jgi:hypothetical protein
VAEHASLYRKTVVSARKKAKVGPWIPASRFDAQMSSWELKTEMLQREQNRLGCLLDSTRGFDAQNLT